MKTYFILFIFLIYSCIPIPSPKQIISMDLQPAELLFWEITVNSMKLTFDEPIENAFCVVSNWEEQPCSGYNTSELTIHFNEGLPKGEELLIRGEVRDKAGNETCFYLPFYLPLPNGPSIVINEFITKGSDSHPDLIELRILSDGDLKGTTLYIGTKESYEDFFIFPHMNVQAGDYVLLHLKPESLSIEINETEDKQLSGGKDSNPKAWDLWMPKESGLSGNNGCITIYRVPKGELLDGLFYTNRTSVSDDKYQGFGSQKFMNQVYHLYQAKGWEFSSDDQISPEDGIWSGYSTATRSLNRHEKSSDTNQKRDWYTAPTRGSTFGTTNNAEIYTP